MKKAAAVFMMTTLAVALITACGGSDETTQSSVPTPPPTLYSSQGADGWATAKNAVVKGGADADAAHTYTVTNRNELIKALYPDAVIADDGTFTTVAGNDKTPKIIYVKGTINLSMNKALKELTEADYKDPAYDFNAYVAAYKPSVWNANPANWDAKNNRPKAVSGAEETARANSSKNQEKIVKLALTANTSLIGLGSDAKIIKGQLSLGSGVDNVVIRNITFEDAFDYFPGWSPTDSFSLITPVNAGCQVAYVDASTGPQKCPGGRWNSNYDLLSINGGKNIWIDHCTLNDGEREDWKFPSVFEAPHKGVDYFIQHHDGAVDITGTSDFVTLSYNVFKNHDKTNLIGSSDTASASSGLGALSVTLHHNWYQNSGQRLPRVRMGKVHVYNNYYSGQIGYLGAYAPVDGSSVPNNRYLYGLGIGHLSKIYSENNVWEIQNAPAGNPAKVDDTVMFYTWHKDAPTSGEFLGEKTYFFDSGSTLNGASRDLLAAANAMAAAAVPVKPVLEPTSKVWTPSSSYTYKLDMAASVKETVVKSAGAGK